MLNDLLIRDLAKTRINELYEAAEAHRLARLARSSRRGDRVAHPRQVFTSLLRGATRITGAVTAAIRPQRNSTESRPGVTAGPKSRPSTQCC